MSKTEPPAPEPAPESKRLPSMRKLIFIVSGVVLAAAIAAGLAVALLVNIFHRKQEGRNPYFRVVELTDRTTDPAVWGKNFPFQYDSYLKTVDQVRTRYGGSNALPRTPTQADPRSVVAQSRLEEDPRLKTIWAGYPFSVDFREERGHAHMLKDQVFTQRQIAGKQPGTCLHCHGSTYVPYLEAGHGDLIAGFEKLNQMPFQEALKHVEHPVTCIDCHEPSTMQLRITKPGFMEGIKAAKAAEGVKDFEVNRDSTRQEMRTYVCAQCHVEYYFKGPEKRLVYPWSKGLKVDEILAHYDEVGHKDWVHELTKAPVLKAQHPEFELWSQGVHARAGVSCADCHMPYERQGAHKVSTHHVRSPLLNINNACQTCHNWSEGELAQRVHTIQDRTHHLRGLAMDAVIDLIGDIKQGMDSGRPDPELAKARDFQRKAQFYLDFIEAENSMGFHASQESARILAESINFARKGQNSLRLRPQPTLPEPTVPENGTGAPPLTPADSPAQSASAPAATAPQPAPPSSTPPAPAPPASVPPAPVAEESTPVVPNPAVNALPPDPAPPANSSTPPPNDSLPPATPLPGDVQIR